MEPTNYSAFNRSKNQVNLNIIHEHEESSQEKTSSSSEDGLTSCQKYITTLILFYIMLAYGMLSVLYGPTLVDFSYIFEASFDTVSLITCMASLGYCVGAFVGFAYEYLNRQLIVIVFMTITGIVNCLTPFSPSVIIYLMIGFVSSFGNGALDAAQNVWLMEMWQDYSNSILQLAHFMFGVGAILAPVIERPFLIGEIHNLHPNSTKHFPNDNGTITITPHDRRMHMISPFIIIGGITLSAIFFLALMFCYKKYEQPNRKQDNNDSQEDKKLFEDAPKWLRVTMIILISFCLGFYISIEYCHFDYLVSYSQYIPLKMSAQDGAFLQSITVAVYTGFRFISAFVALKLSPFQMLVIHYTVVLCSNIVLLLFGSTSKLILWVVNMFLGAGFSAMWGSIFAFAEQYMVLGNAAGTSLIAAAGSSSLISLFFIGKLIKSNPDILIQFNIINLLVSIFIFIIINLIIKWWSRKSKKQIKRTMNYNYSKRMSICSMGAMGSTASYLRRRSSGSKL